MNKVLILAIALFGICIFAQIGFATQMAVESSSGPTISVEEPYIKVSQEDTFTVNITVNPKGVEIYGAQYELYFDPVLLNVVSQQKGGTFLSQDGNETAEIANGFDNTNGKVEYGEFRVGDPEVIGGVTNPGVLASIPFKAIRGGISNLTLDVILTDTTLSQIQNVTVNNGTVEIEAYIFDTDSPENPYPSIFGIHNGTIKPDQPIVARKMFTYSCPGTGGHAEFVRIWGNDVDANATWSGYVDDWHNLTFNRTFTLEPGVEYNYTIKTGSYPQIHHSDTDELEVANGTITCTKFTDANGRTYNNWIPAIRLFL